MKLVKKFAANYEIRQETELPSSGGALLIIAPGDKQTAGFGGPLLKITGRDGRDWLAGFGGGYPGGDVVDGIFTTPDPDTVCVIFRGSGYWIDTQTRTKRDISVFPIRQVEVAPGRLLFADFTKLACYGRSGTEWVSASLASDQLRITAIDLERQKIRCEGLDAASGSNKYILVDLSTGR